MSRQFRDPSSDAWFRLGSVDVTTTTLATGILALGMVASTIVPAFAYATYFDPTAVLTGQVWRLVTWPLAGGFSVWGLLSLVMFWFFGTELERQSGRNGMAWFLGGLVVALTAAYALAALLVGGGGLAGPGLLQVFLLLIWIAENPARPLFFAIPAWVVGAVLFGLNLLTILATRDWAGLLALLLSVVFVAVAARRAGLLSAYDWIPGRPAVKKPKAYRQADAPTSRQAKRRASDSQRMDELLDKIHSQGIHSLTEAERQELLKLRERRRGGA